MWEYLNYALAIAGLALVWSVHRLLRRKAQHRIRVLLVGGRA